MSEQTEIEITIKVRDELPRVMLECGVEGDLFRMHLENKECKAAGCVVATDEMLHVEAARLKRMGIP